MLIAQRMAAGHEPEHQATLKDLPDEEMGKSRLPRTIYESSGVIN